MATTINANTTDGLVITPDTSGEISFQSNGTTVAGMNSAGWTGDGSQLTGVGKILQVVQVYDNAQSSYTMLNINNGYTNYGLNENGIDLTTLDTTITPTSTSSKILIMTNVMYSARPAVYGVFRLKRGIGGSSPTYSGMDWISSNTSVAGNLSQAGSTGFSTNGDTNWQSRILNFNWLDSPNTTSEVKYRMNFRAEQDNGDPFWLNRSYYTTNDYGATSGVSSIILMEVAG